MKVHTICVAFERPIPLQSLINCFVLQTDPDWTLHIIYDGPAPDSILEIIAPVIPGGNRHDPRIHFYQSPERYQKYGHPNRRTMLHEIMTDPKDFILMQNDDNYMIPRTVEFIKATAQHDTGIIYWDTVHSHMNYDLHVSELKENYIDMASFVVRADIAKSTGFNHDHFSADGRYAEECAETCRQKHLKVVKIKKPLLVHN